MDPSMYIPVSPREAYHMKRGSAGKETAGKNNVNAMSTESFFFPG
jgi:hypothetical protein